MLCRVYTCWIPARRSSHIWSRPICFSPWGFWVLFDDIVEPLVLSSPYRTMPSLSCSGERSPPGSSPRLIFGLTRSALRVCSPSGSSSSTSGSWLSVVRQDAVPLYTLGWRSRPLLHLKASALLTRWPAEEMKYTFIYFKSQSEKSIIREASVSSVLCW